MRSALLFLCSAVLATAGISGPGAYNIIFNVTAGGPMPTGSFVYDPATGFSNFIVQWNGKTFDVTAAANAPATNGSFSLACTGLSGPAAGFAIISKSITGCTGLINYEFGVYPEGILIADLNQQLVAGENPNDVFGIGIADIPGNVTVNVSALGTWTIAPAIGGMAQLSSGGGWDTLLTLVNTGASAANAMLSFYDNNGAALPLPVTFPQGTLPVQTSTTLSESLNPFQMLEIDTNDTADAAGLTGETQVGGPGIDGFAIFRYTPTGQEAVVPLEKRLASAYTLAFDNTNGISTGVALANLSAIAESIAIKIRDETGAALFSGSIQLKANGHTSFLLADPTAGYVVTANKRGTVEFDTPSGGQIAVLGLRAAPIANGSFSVTTIPVIANAGAGTGSMAQVSAGGGWKTTFTLVNTGTTTAHATLTFHDNSGAALSVPILDTQTQNNSTVSSLSETLTARQTMTFVANDTVNSDTGSAVLTTDGSVSGFAIFEYTPTGQEAVVPLETRNAKSYVLAFDNTNGLVTGIAVANLSGQQANIGVTIRDDTGATLSTTSLTLPGQGHTSFLLTDQYAVTAGMRGTIEFTGPGSTQISVLGLRTAPTGAGGAFAVTTTPPLVASTAGD